MSENFIVDPSNVSFSSIMQDLQDFVDSAPDSAKWKDFFASSTGQLLMQLVAGLGAYLQYNNIVARRETFLRYSQNRSSVVAGAETLGYSCYRGANPRVKLTIVPNSTGFLPKWTVLGSVKDKDLLLESDTVVNAGVAVQLTAIIGTVQEQQRTVESIEPSFFRYDQDLVSDDIRLYLNGSEVQTSNKILDLINAKFVCQSNVFGSVDVMYLNLDTFALRFNTGDILTLRWVELADTSFETSDIKITIGTYVSNEVSSTYALPETIDNIKINAPLFNETQFVIRGRLDYLKIFKLLDASIVDTAGKDISPAVVELYAVRDDLSLFTSTYKTTLINELAQNRPFGIQPPIIGDPRTVFMNLQITADLLSAGGNPTNDFSAIVAQYENKLGQYIDFHDVERQINNLSYVQINRITFDPDTWAINTKYRRGNLVIPATPNGLMYEQMEVVCRSGSSEPTWPTHPTNYQYVLGQTVDDGTMRWVAVAKTAVVPAWQANHLYEIDDAVVPSSPSYPHPEVMFVKLCCIRKSAHEVLCTTASATYEGVTFTAVVCGAIGNSITLEFDGIKTVQEVVDAWNTAHPDNQVTYYPPTAGTAVLAAGTVQLSGGAGAQASAVYDGVTFTAQLPGLNGNLISLDFDGVQTVDNVVNNWNTANPDNPVGYEPPSAGGDIPVEGSADLTGGQSANSGEPAWPSSGAC